MTTTSISSNRVLTSQEPDMHPSRKVRPPRIGSETSVVKLHQSYVRQYKSRKQACTKTSFITKCSTVIFTGTRAHEQISQTETNADRYTFELIVSAACDGRLPS